MAASSAAAGRAAARRTLLTRALPPAQLRLLVRLAALAAAALAVKSFVLDPLTGHFGGSFEDFAAYMGAARFMAHGGSPYAQFSSATPVMSGFTYPPFAAVLVQPLAVLTDRQALSVWLALSLATTVAAALIVARTALPASWPRVELAVLAAIAFGPAAYNYWHGQINGLIFLLLAVALWAYVNGRQSTAGFVLGLAAGIKLAPAVLVVLLLRRCWWRGAAVMIATVAATVGIGALALGMGPTRTFVQTVLPTLSRPMGWLYNQSLIGALSRLTGHSVLLTQPTPPALEAACWAAAAALLGVTLWVTRSAARPAGERSAEFGLGVTTMLLAGSLAWYPHFTALLIPLAAAFGLASTRGWRREGGLVIAAALALIVFAVVAPLGIAALSMSALVRISRTPLWWPFLQLSSLPGLVALWLAVRLRATLGRQEDAA